MNAKLLLTFYNMYNIKRITDGFLRSLTGFDYCRTFEWPVVYNSLKLGERIDHLDIGSGDASFFPLLLVHKKNINATFVDYSDPMDLLKVRISKLKAKRQTESKAKYINGDARNLPFKANSFDSISCVSTIEHIPDDGDVLSLKEFERVLRPGGILVISVPMSSEFRLEYKMDHVYERKEKGSPIFFQKIYDVSTLNNRLLKATALKCIRKEFLIEPKKHFFWEQDCQRVHNNGVTLLSNAPPQTRFSRFLNLFRALRFIRTIGEKDVVGNDAKLIVGIISFQKI